MAKEISTGSYCLFTCTEHPVNVNLSFMKISMVSYITACSADFDIVVETVIVTVLCT